MARTYENDNEKSMEWKRSKLYVEIGTFYKKIMLAQIEGTDSGMYSEYWNNLMDLKQFNDENPDREIITLRLYREIASRTAEYAGSLLEDGVAKEDIEVLFGDIREEMREMDKQANRSIRQEISQINELLNNAENMLASSETPLNQEEQDEGGIE